jgi:hypothetical protein
MMEGMLKQVMEPGQKLETEEVEVWHTRN